MQWLQDPDEDEEWPPFWGAFAVSVSVLYGLWPVFAMYDAANDIGKFLLLFVGLIPFGLAFGLAGVLLNPLIRLPMIRGAVLFFMILVFLLVRGMPSLFTVLLCGFVFVYIYFHGSRMNQDARDRRAFLDE